MSPPDSQSPLFHRCAEPQGGSSCCPCQQAGSGLALAGMPAAEGLLFTALAGKCVTKHGHEIRGVQSAPRHSPGYLPAGTGLAATSPTGGGTQGFSSRRTSE